MKSYKLQKLDDDTLMINWKYAGNYIVILFCVCIAICFLGLEIYIFYITGYHYRETILSPSFGLFILFSISAYFFSIMLPVKAQLILNKNKRTIHLKPYNIYGNIINSWFSRLDHSSENLFSYSSVKSIKPEYIYRSGIYIKISMKTNNEFIYILVNSNREAEEIIFIIQDFFKNYDNSSFSQE